jgi:uncharacterized protein (TIGR02597 family)
MKKCIHHLLFLSILTTASLPAAEVVSQPVGFLRVVIPAGMVTSFSIPLQTSPLAVGAATAIGTSTMSDSTAVWTTGQFSLVGKPYFVKFVSGPATGRYFLITGNTANQLTIDTRGANLTTAVAIGNRYQISAGRTLGSLFGTSAVPFLSNSSITLADNLRLWSGSAWETYWHNGSSWMRYGQSTVQNNVVIYPDEGMEIIRRGTSALTITIAGEASMITEQTEVIGSATTFAANRYPVNVTLKNLGLLSLPNWIFSTNSAAADRVQVRQGGQLVTYWHTGTNWIKAGTTASQDNASVPAGTGYLILRKNYGSNGFAKQPRPY